MSDFVRAKSKTTGHEVTVSRARANQSADLDIIGNKHAVNINGTPLPPKTRHTAASTAPSDPKPGKKSEEDK